jgi:hypothetical protein
VRTLRLRVRLVPRSALTHLLVALQVSVFLSRLSLSSVECPDFTLLLFDKLTRVRTLRLRVRLVPRSALTHLLVALQVPSGVSMTDRVREEPKTAVSSSVVVDSL